MKQNKPLISIIVPIYNVEKYLDRCIDSITRQTYRNLEIILIEDGSADCSLSVCRKWAGQDKRVRLIVQSNQGIGCVRNTGLAKARGEYIGFVDGDDWVEADMYESLWGMLAQEKADIASCAHYREIGTRCDLTNFIHRGG